MLAEAAMAAAVARLKAAGVIAQVGPVGAEFEYPAPALATLQLAPGVRMVVRRGPRRGLDCDLYLTRRGRQVARFKFHAKAGGATNRAVRRLACSLNGKGDHARLVARLCRVAARAGCRHVADLVAGRAAARLNRLSRRNEAADWVSRPVI